MGPIFNRNIKVRARTGSVGRNFDLGPYALGMDRFVSGIGCFSGPTGVIKKGQIESCQTAML